MLRDGLLPSPKRFLGLGFWGDRQARAYTAAGSFVRFLGDTYGMEKVRSAYAWGSVEEAFGKDAERLGDEWRTYLATVDVPPKQQAAARERFTEPSLFERTCARELARLEAEGRKALAAGRLDDAAALFEEWRALDDRPEPLRAILDLRRRIEREDALTLARRLAEREIPDSPGFWRAKMTVADVAWDGGDLSAAVSGYREVFQAKPTPDLERDAWFKWQATTKAGAERPSDRAVAKAMKGWFGSWQFVPLVASTSAAAIDGSSSAFHGSYLIGRRLLKWDYDAEQALPWLEAAARLSRSPGAVESAAVRTETLAMRADALTRLGRLEEAREAWAELASIPEAPPDVRERAADGESRVAWKAAHAAKSEESEEHALDAKGAGP